MWKLDHKESWALNNWCYWTVVLEKTPESPLDCKEAKPVNPKGNQAWIFIGRTDAEVEAPILWPPDAKNLLTGKDPDAGKDWRQEEKGMAEDEMVGSLTQWTWVWPGSGRWWRTGKPGVLQSRGSWRVKYAWVTEQRTTTMIWSSMACLYSYTKFEPWSHPIPSCWFKLSLTASGPWAGSLRAEWSVIFPIIKSRN